MNPAHRTVVVGVAGLLLITTLGVMGGVRPILADHAEAVALRASLGGAREQLDRLRQTEAGLAKNLAALEIELGSYQMLSDASNAVNARLSELTQLASVSGVEIESVRPGSKETGPRFDIVPIRLAGRGSFSDIVGFVSRLRRTFPDLGLVRVRFDRTGDGMALLDADIRWFFAREGGADGAGGAVPGR